MKKFRAVQIAAGVALATGLLGIVGCGGGGSGVTLPNPLIAILTGSYKATAIQQTPTSTNNACPTVLVISPTDTESCTFNDILNFNADGTFSRVSNNVTVATGTWSVSGTTLTVVTANETATYAASGVTGNPNISLTQLTSTSVPHSQSNGVIFYETKQ